MTVYIGIDWSQAKHDVCVLNEAGAAVAQFALPHLAEGLLKLEEQRQQLPCSCRRVWHACAKRIRSPRPVRCRPIRPKR